MMSDNGMTWTNGSSQRINETHSGVVEYLSKLGLDESDLDKVTRMLQTIKQGAPYIGNQFRSNEPKGYQPGAMLEFQREELMQLLMGDDERNIHVAEEPAGDTVHPQERPKPADNQVIKLLVAEEQMVLNEAYRSYFDYSPSFDASGFFGDTSESVLKEAISRHSPQVLLLGLKCLDSSVVKKLEMIRESCPQAGLVLLFALYDASGANALREFSNSASAGYAYLLKHNIDTADQLGKVVQGVAQKRVIVDPEVMEELIDDPTPESQLLVVLTPKEMQVLSWMARGFANKTIANVLSIDTKAVERQVSNIYTKLRLSDEGRDARVSAALLFLKATGMLPTG